MPENTVRQLPMNPRVPACNKRRMLTGSPNQVNVGFMTLGAGIPSTDTV